MEWKMGMELKERKVLSKRTVSKTTPLEECDDESTSQAV